MADDLSRRLRSATGAGDRFCITVLADGSRPRVAHEFNYPYAIVGRGEGCDIILPDPEISFRHAYLQVIEGRVFCVDLASRNGVRWPDGPAQILAGSSRRVPSPSGRTVCRCMEKRRPRGRGRLTRFGAQSAGALPRRSGGHAQSRPGIPLRDRAGELDRQPPAHALGPQSPLQAAI